MPGRKRKLRAATSRATTPQPPEENGELANGNGAENAPPPEGNRAQENGNGAENIPPVVENGQDPNPGEPGDGGGAPRRRRRPPNEIPRHINFFPTELKKYECKTCKKRFRSKGNCNYHWYCGRERPLACERCSLRFITRQHLDIHLRSHTQERPFCCKKCNKSFFQRSKYSRHLKSKLHKLVSKKIEKWALKERFNRRPVLKVKTNNEVNVSPREDLRKQRPPPTNNEDRSFKCDYKSCGWCFGTLKDLDRHRATHFDEYPYKCELCPTKFNRKENMVRHVTKCHAETKEVGLAMAERVARAYLERNLDSMDHIQRRHLQSSVRRAIILMAKKRQLKLEGDENIEEREGSPQPGPSSRVRIRIHSGSPQPGPSSRVRIRMHSGSPQPGPSSGVRIRMDSDPPTTIQDLPPLDGPFPSDSNSSDCEDSVSEPPPLGDWSEVKCSVFEVPPADSITASDTTDMANYDVVREFVFPSPLEGVQVIPHDMQLNTRASVKEEASEIPLEVPLAPAGSVDRVEQDKPMTATGSRNTVTPKDEKEEEMPDGVAPEVLPGPIELSNEVASEGPTGPQEIHGGVAPEGPIGPEGSHNGSVQTASPAIPMNAHAVVVVHDTSERTEDDVISHHLNNEVGPSASLPQPGPSFLVYRTRSFSPVATTNGALPQGDQWIQGYLTQQPQRRLSEEEHSDPPPPCEPGRQQHPQIWSMPRADFVESTARMNNAVDELVTRISSQMRPDAAMPSPGPSSQASSASSVAAATKNRTPQAMIPETPREMSGSEFARVGKPEVPVALVHVEVMGEGDNAEPMDVDEPDEGNHELVANMEGVRELPVRAGNGVEGSVRVRTHTTVAGPYPWRSPPSEFSDDDEDEDMERPVYPLVNEASAYGQAITLPQTPPQDPDDELIQPRSPIRSILTCIVVQIIFLAISYYLYVLFA